MTTKTEITLPCLPAPGEAMSKWAYDETDMQAYARQAIEADRQRRGHPIAWVKPDIVEDQFINMRPRRVWWECNEGIGVAIYTAPQPAESIPSNSTELGGTAEPVKVPSELSLDNQRLVLWQAIESIKVGNKWDDKSILRNLHAAGYVIARYGQPAQPAASAEPNTIAEVWRINAVEAEGQGNIEVASVLRDCANEIERLAAPIAAPIAASAEPTESAVLLDALSGLVKALRERHHGRMPDEVQAAYDKAWAIVFSSPVAAPVAQEPVAWLRNERGTSSGLATFDPLVLLSEPVDGAFRASYQPLYAAPIAAQAQPSAQAKCQTCGGRGWVGGPSYYTPDEGGEPCPDCAQDREDAIPDSDAVDLAREGMELHKPGQPEYIVCAELVRVAARAAKGADHG